MGRSKHYSVDVRWPIVMANTSHDAHRRPLEVRYRKWYNPNVPPPQNSRNMCKMHLQWEYAYLTDET